MLLSCQPATHIWHYIQFAFFLWASKICNRGSVVAPINLGVLGGFMMGSLQSRR
jgi:hypothetical protein